MDVPEITQLELDVDTPERSFVENAELQEQCHSTCEQHHTDEGKEITNYLQHQSSMHMQEKTTAALKEKHNAPSTRKQMFGVLKTKGLYKKFPAHKLKRFDTWLTPPSGGQMKCTEAIINEVSRFLYFCNPQEIKWKNLLDSKSLNSYLIVTKDAGLGPDGLKTKIERMVKALKYLAHRKKQLYNKCHGAIDDYREWLKPLIRQNRVLRMKNSWRDELCGFNLTMEDLDSAVTKETSELFMSIMNNAMLNKKLTQEDYRVIVDTLITITITQESAIRPDAFQFMTLQELDNPITYISPTDGTVYDIVFVLNHKTVGTHGPLAVPFPVLENFDSSAEIKCDVPAESKADFFFGLMFGMSVLQHIVAETNRYGRQKLANNADPLGKWIDTTMKK